MKSVEFYLKTANERKCDSEACLAAGMGDYLCKPIRHDFLLHKLLLWLKTDRVGPDT